MLELIFNRIMEISCVSQKEYIKLQASFLAATHDNFRCKEIESYLSERDDAELQIRLRREDKGCGQYTTHTDNNIDGYDFHSCLCHPEFQYPRFNSLMYKYRLFNKGILPYRGCLSEQPNKILEIFKIFDSMYHELKLENEAKKSKK